MALVLMLAAWTGLFAVALREDPHAASDSALLLARSAYADGNQYLPNLFIRHWSEGAPGLWARILVWVAGLGAIGWWLRRVSVSSRRGRTPRGVSPLATLAAVTGIVLAVGLFLERWPGKRVAPSFPGALAAPGTSTLLFVEGAASVREDEALLGPGAVELLVRAPAPVGSLRVTLGGQGGVLRAAGLPPLVLRPTGALVDLPLAAYHEVRGRDGRDVIFCRTTLALDSEAILRVGEMEPERGEAR